MTGLHTHVFDFYPAGPGDAAKKRFVRVWAGWHAVCNNGSGL